MQRLPGFDGRLLPNMSSNNNSPVRRAFEAWADSPEPDTEAEAAAIAAAFPALQTRAVFPEAPVSDLTLQDVAIIHGFEKALGIEFPQPAAPPQAQPAAACLQLPPQDQQGSLFADEALELQSSEGSITKEAGSDTPVQRQASTTAEQRAELSVPSQPAGMQSLPVKSQEPASPLAETSHTPTRMPDSGNRPKSKPVKRHLGMPPRTTFEPLPEEKWQQTPQSSIQRQPRFSVPSLHRGAGRQHGQPELSLPRAGTASYTSQFPVAGSSRKVGEEETKPGSSESSRKQAAAGIAVLPSAEPAHLASLESRASPRDEARPWQGGLASQPKPPESPSRKMPDTERDPAFCLTRSKQVPPAVDVFVPRLPPAWQPHRLDDPQWRSLKLPHRTRCDQPIAAERPQRGGMDPHLGMANMRRIFTPSLPGYSASWARKPPWVNHRWHYYNGPRKQGYEPAARGASGHGLDFERLLARTRAGRCEKATDSRRQDWVTTATQELEEWEARATALFKESPRTAEPERQPSTSDAIAAQVLEADALFSSFLQQPIPSEVFDLQEDYQQLLHDSVGELADPCLPQAKQDSLQPVRAFEEASRQPNVPDLLGALLEQSGIASSNRYAAVPPSHSSQDEEHGALKELFGKWAVDEWGDEHE